GTPILLPILVPLVHFILIPFEHLVRIKYIKSAKRKLQKFPDLIKIGITGSYGKTSTKYILNTILSQSFNVCISPFSFNTPMGLTKVVHSYLKPEHEVLIAEMGARQVGDIAFLCDIIKPKYGILTSVGNQHLSTFFSIENITKTKYELIDSLPEDGLAIFNGDNEICVNLQKNCKKKSLLTAISNENAFAHAKNVTVGHKGISFTLCINSEEIDCCTKLLGLHNLENILLCCALASHLGLTLKQISKGISELKPLSHRLEITSANGIHILDDSYNSSVKGSEAALNVLEMFPSKKKIIITPGLVELGGKEYAENFNFGKKMAKVASHVIVVNETHKEAISEGLLSEGFGQDKIIFAENLIAAQLQLKTIIKKGDIVLFENDLPDNYT
ncbi:MAG: UDP-N-acetylmuramoyl-tripeptide--D-alanyl-D-alanine ligase, partial [Clostridia bacterium]